MDDGSRIETDVVILGGGLAGSTAALCLVRQGLRVMVLDRGTHPRFALGESTTTPSSLWIKVLAERYDAPELHHITTGEGVRRHVAPTSGVKSNFGFLYHEEGAAAPARSWQAVIPQAEFSDEDVGPPQSSEMHFFRQDVDEYLWNTALGAGAVGRSGCEVTAVSFRDDGATIETAAGETIDCGFVIDASGYRSVVASALGLREDPPRWRTNSRAMFTHMTGVKPFEDVDDEAQPLAPWSQGTLHHFFDGGWMWVIPFGNYPGSQNELCSVGLCFDNARFPRDPGVRPEDAWAGFLARFPAIARQFEGAVPVRPWISTDRLQYSSSRCVGERFWLTPHAAGAVDALYSMGNINVFQALATGVRLVLEAFEEDAFTADHFQPLQRLTDNLLRFQDRIVYGSYAGLRSPELLELWFTLWGLTDGARVREVLKPLVRYARTGRREDLCTYDARPEDVLTGFGQSTEIVRAEEALERLDEFCDVMRELEQEEATGPETAIRLRAAMESDERFDMHVDAILTGLGEHPWIFEPLRRHGVKAYGTAFLTPDELFHLGVRPDERLAPRNGTAPVSDAEEDRREWERERREFRVQADELRKDLYDHRARTAELERELAAHRKQSEALEQEVADHRAQADGLLEQLAAHRAQAASLVAERNSYSAHADALNAELAAHRAQQVALSEERDALRGQAAALEEARDALLEERAALAEHRDALLAERAALVEDRDAHQREREALQRDRDALARAQGELEQDRDAWRERASLAEERVSRSLPDKVKRSLGGLARRGRAGTDR